MSITSALRQALSQRRIKIRASGQDLAAGRGQQGNCLVQVFSA